MISTEESDKRFPVEIEASLLGLFGEQWRRVIARRAGSAGVTGPARAATGARRQRRARELGSASFFSIIILSDKLFPLINPGA